jgi:serine/threonine protein kinase
VDRPVGTGAMGEVWLAHHETTRKQGALKLVHADTGEDAEHTERFRREVEVLASLRHPAVVGLLDAGEVGGKPWLVMEYVAGQNLEHRLRDGPPVDPSRVLLEFAALADGLAYAHVRGIHHRDIKAANVVVDATGRAVLVDFGVALHLSSSRLTKAGNVMGTMAYLPPEVLEGAPPDGATHDQYALGQLLHEVLTGKLAFRDGPEGRAKFGALVAEKGNALDPGPGFPDKVRAVVRRSTDPEPGDRFPSIADLGRALEPLLTRAQRTELDRRLGRSNGDGTARWKWALALLIVFGFLSAFALGGAVAALLIVLLLLR